MKSSKLTAFSIGILIGVWMLIMFAIQRNHDAHAQATASASATASPLPASSQVMVFSYFCLGGYCLQPCVSGGSSLCYYSNSNGIPGGFLGHFYPTQAPTQTTTPSAT